jgi:ribosomal protein L31E
VSKITIKIKDMKYKTLKNKELKEAAKLIKRRIDRHFKSDGWDLDFNFVVEEVFYEAFKESLSTYLIDALSTKQGKYEIVANKNGLLLRLTDK